MKRTSLLLSLAVLIGLSSAGCQIVASPMLGAIYTEAKYGTVATDASAATKEGKACGQSILGWIATGDASISAAKAEKATCRRRLTLYRKQREKVAKWAKLFKP